jgi:hypothetical protein
VTAQALESNLSSLEKKLDDLLASFEAEERMKVDALSIKEEGKTGSEGTSETDTSKKEAADDKS